MKEKEKKRQQFINGNELVSNSFFKLKRVFVFYCCCVKAKGKAMDTNTGKSPGYQSQS